MLRRSIAQIRWNTAAPSSPTGRQQTLSYKYLLKMNTKMRRSPYIMCRAGLGMPHWRPDCCVNRSVLALSGRASGVGTDASTPQPPHRDSGSGAAKIQTTPRWQIQSEFCNTIGGKAVNRRQSNVCKMYEKEPRQSQKFPRTN